jgi:hypothetical protein
VLALFNASDRRVEFVLPGAARDPAWRVLFDTAGPAVPAVPVEARILPCRTLLVIEPRSVILLEAHADAGQSVAQERADRMAGASDAR